MAITIYYINIRIEHESAARFYLNDLPVWKFLRHGADSMNAGANSWLVPGENVLTLDIVQAPLTLPNMPPGRPTLEVTIFKAAEGATEPTDVEIVHQVQFPQMWDDVDEDLKTFPYRHESRFTLPDADVYRPVFLDAPEQEIPSEGTPELRKAVQNLHDAVKSNDGSRFADQVALQFEEYERASGGVADTDVASQRKTSDEFFAHPIEVKDLEMDRLVFESRSNGRIVHVVRDDGRPVLMARATDDPSEQFQGNVLLTHHDGRWRAF